MGRETEALHNHTRRTWPLGSLQRVASARGTGSRPSSGTRGPEPNSYCLVLWLQAGVAPGPPWVGGATAFLLENVCSGGSKNSPNEGMPGCEGAD